VALPARTFFVSTKRRHTRSKRDWSSDVCSSDLEPAALVGEDAGFQWPLGIVGADKAHRFAIANGLSGLCILIDAAAYFIRQIRYGLGSAVVDRELMHAKTLAHKFTQGVFPCIHASRGAGLAGIANHRHPA